MAQETQTNVEHKITCDKCGKTIPGSADVFRVNVQQRVAQKELPPGYDWNGNSTPPEHGYWLDFCSWDHLLAHFGAKDVQATYQTQRDDFAAALVADYEALQEAEAEAAAEAAADKS